MHMRCRLWDARKALARPRPCGERCGNSALPSAPTLALPHTHVDKQLGMHCVPPFPVPRGSKAAGGGRRRRTTEGSSSALMHAAASAPYVRRAASSAVACPRRRRLGLIERAASPPPAASAPATAHAHAHARSAPASLERRRRRRRCSRPGESRAQRSCERRRRKVSPPPPRTPRNAPRAARAAPSANPRLDVYARLGHRCPAPSPTPDAAAPCRPPTPPLSTSEPTSPSPSRTAAAPAARIFAARRPARGSTARSASCLSRGPSGLRNRPSRRIRGIGAGGHEPIPSSRRRAHLPAARPAPSRCRARVAQHPPHPTPRAQPAYRAKSTTHLRRPSAPVPTCTSLSLATRAPAAHPAPPPKPPPRRSSRVALRRRGLAYNAAPPRYVLPFPARSRPRVRSSAAHPAPARPRVPPVWSVRALVRGAGLGPLLADTVERLARATPSPLCALWRTAPPSTSRESCGIRAPSSSPRPQPAVPPPTPLSVPRPVPRLRLRSLPRGRVPRARPNSTPAHAPPSLDPARRLAASPPPAPRAHLPCRARPIGTSRTRANRLHVAAPTRAAAQFSEPYAQRRSSRVRTRGSDAVQRVGTRRRPIRAAALLPPGLRARDSQPEFGGGSGGLVCPSRACCSERERGTRWMGRKSGGASKAAELGVSRQALDLRDQITHEQRFRPGMRTGSEAARELNRIEAERRGQLFVPVGRGQTQDWEDETKAGARETKNGGLRGHDSQRGSRRRGVRRNSRETIPYAAAGGVSRAAESGLIEGCGVARQ
ncbi:hypothetical protein B0H15DRAFT_1027925 [Mycena belliarum]|uniref:Uncharacterized protein n=1 Tax=Mycena belliarum TaxID=1033014 RepID=A0AAD6XHX1_9AGAR|nr:hypothetical protein B0H15DRAFT_1027925 [Mycena belliae]